MSSTKKPLTLRLLLSSEIITWPPNLTGLLIPFTLAVTSRNLQAVSLVYWLHLFGSVLARRLPTWCSYTVVEHLGSFGLRFYRPQKRNALRNMRRLLGPDASRAEVQSRVDAVFRNYGKYMVDLLRLPSLGSDVLLSSIKVDGIEHIDEALARGRGLILVTGHIGNWDHAGAVLSAQRYAVAVVVDTLTPPRWNAKVQAIRRELGMNAIPTENGIRDMVQVLRRNQILGILIDKPLSDGGAEVQFLGRQTRVPAGAATLALRTGAMIVPAVIVRDGDQFRAHVGEPIRPEKSGDRSADVQVMTQCIMSRLEGWIRQYPEQWFMFRDMWPSAV